MTKFQHQTICRFCHALCDMLVAVEDGRVTRVVGSKDNPMFFGYTCKKGRSLPEQHYSPARLLHCGKLQDDGRHADIPSERAFDEIAAKLKQIIRDHGPRAIALYSGSQTASQFWTGNYLANSFFEQIGSPMIFGPGSIDQPGKPLALAMHGNWGGGAIEFHDSDSCLLIGTNTAISKLGFIPLFNPEKRLRDEQARGLRLIVIDPRRSETAERADIHIQPIPGEDPTILAGIIRVLLEEKLHDAAFVEAEVEGLDSLRAAVAPFTPEYVSRRARIPAEQIIAAARLFAADRAGRAGCGTGPNMAARGTLTEYLTLVLNTLVGSWRRAGDLVANPGVLAPPIDWRAQALKRPEKASGYGTRLRVRGLGESAAGLPTSALAEEILLEGEGQVRALFNLGGNPMASWPDQKRTHAAMQTLELSVTCDRKMSVTARFSHYVIPPKLTFEVPNTTRNHEMLPAYGLPSFPGPYAQYAPAIVAPPEGADVVEEWELFYGLAQRMGLQLDMLGQPVDMVNKPTTDDLLELASVGSRIPLSEVKAKPGGRLFLREELYVAPKAEGWGHRLDVGNAEMIDELTAVAAEPLLSHLGFEADEPFPFRLVSRRMRDVYNSCGQEVEVLLASYRYNPAFMNPQDMEELGISDGDVVTISNEYATIRGIARAEEALRPGVVSMAHGWGGAPGDNEDPAVDGACTSRLVDATRWFDPRSGIPVMSALPVRVTKEGAGGTGGARELTSAAAPV
jgi:anaerobic selenocysteine-containing dehydrogenase